MYPYKSHDKHEVLAAFDRSEPKLELCQRPDRHDRHDRPDHYDHHDHQDRHDRHDHDHHHDDRDHPNRRPIPLPYPPSTPVTPGKPPSFRPPNILPRREESLRYVDPRALSRCEGNLVYLWLKNGKSNWMFLTDVSRGTVSGYSWTVLGWKYTGFDLDFVEAFYCFG